MVSSEKETEMTTLSSNPRHARVVGVVQALTPRQPTGPLPCPHCEPEKHSAMRARRDVEHPCPRCGAEGFEVRLANGRTELRCQSCTPDDLLRFLGLSLSDLVDQVDPREGSWLVSARDGTPLAVHHETQLRRGWRSVEDPNLPPSLPPGRDRADLALFGAETLAGQSPERLVFITAHPAEAAALRERFAVLALGEMGRCEPSSDHVEALRGRALVLWMRDAERVGFWRALAEQIGSRVVGAVSTPGVFEANPASIGTSLVVAGPAGLVDPEARAEVLRALSGSEDATLAEKLFGKRPKAAR
jgi:hypothetical protein